MGMIHDFTVERFRGVAFLQPWNDCAWEWAEQNIDYQEWQIMGGAICIEPSMIDDFAAGATEYGLTVGME